MEWINKLTMEERWFYGTVVAFITTIIAVWFSQQINHILTARRSKKDFLRSHIPKFKSVFSDQTTYINSDFSGLNMFSTDFYNTQTAVEDIMPILSKRYNRKLQKAWNKYCGKNNNLGLNPKEYVAKTSSHTNNTEFKKFKKRFNHLYTCLDKLLR